MCLCVFVVPWDSRVVSASHLVTWRRTGQLWVACVKVSWLSELPEGLCVFVCVFDEAILHVCVSVCVCVCVRLWNTVPPFSS